MTLDEFRSRFTARLVALAGPTRSSGASTAEYAALVAGGYYEDLGEPPITSPEAAAEIEFREWSEE